MPAAFLVRRSRCSLALAVALASLGFPACRQEPAIEKYKFPKVDAVADRPRVEGNDRMLAAMVLTPQKAWFFKVTGPKAEVSKHADEFQTFLGTLRFADSGQGEPQWTLPSGWSQEPGTELSYAVLKIPAEGKPLELTVTALPKPPEDDEPYALLNINRWRDQMQLGPISQEQLAAEAKQTKIDGHPAYVVSVVGTARPRMTGAPSFR